MSTIGNDRCLRTRWANSAKINAAPYCASLCVSCAIYRALWRERTTTKTQGTRPWVRSTPSLLLLLGSVDDRHAPRCVARSNTRVDELFDQAIPSIFYAFEIVQWPQNGTSPLGLIITVSVAALLLFIPDLPWRNGWPRWSASWYLYWGVAYGAVYLLSVWQPTQTLNNSTVGFVVLPVRSSSVIQNYAR